MATSISFVGLSCFLLSLCLVCSLKEGYAFEELIESYTESYLTHTFEVSSLFASSICNHSTKANERESTFRVVDKYSPCFQPSLHRSPPSLTDIIRSDRARIYSIQARLSKDSGRRDLIVETNSLRIPVIDVDPPSPTKLCSYEVSYGDGSISVGFFSKETLTMSAAEKINSFLFGCGTENTGPFNLEAGVLGNKGLECGDKNTLVGVECNEGP
ncbi:hypothetical protein QYF36_008244 [Acer negundo]|nr:hypothetical protein QYF36_008244 [Acer negundo]